MRVYIYIHTHIIHIYNLAMDGWLFYWWMSRLTCNHSEAPGRWRYLHWSSAAMESPFWQWGFQWENHRKSSTNCDGSMIFSCQAKLQSGNSGSFFPHHLRTSGWCSSMFQPYLITGGFYISRCGPHHICHGPKMGLYNFWSFHHHWESLYWPL